MLALAEVVILPVNLDGAWDEREVGNVTFMRLFDQRHAHLLHHFAVLILSVFFVLLLLAWFPCSVFIRRDVPCDDLAIQTATDDNFFVLWVECKRCDLNWGQQIVRQQHHLWIRKVKHQDVSVKRLAHLLDTLVELNVLH